MNLLESSDYLRVVELKVIPHEVCEKQYKRFQILISTNKICAAHPDDINGKDACQVIFSVSLLFIFSQFMFTLLEKKT